MNLKKIGKVFTSKSVGTGSSSYKKKNLPGRGLTKVEKHWRMLQERVVSGDGGLGSTSKEKMIWIHDLFGLFNTTRNTAGFQKYFFF